MSEGHKKPVKMTTEEAIGKLFPKRVVRTAKRFVAANARAKQSRRAGPPVRAS